VWHDSFICVTWLIHMCDMTHSYVWHDSFICVTWLMHMTHNSFMSHVSHDSHDTWMRDMNESYHTWTSHVSYDAHSYASHGYMSSTQTRVTSDTICVYVCITVCMCVSHILCLTFERNACLHTYRVPDTICHIHTEYVTYIPIPDTICVIHTYIPCLTWVILCSTRNTPHAIHVEMYGMNTDLRYVRQIMCDTHIHTLSDVYQTCIDWRESDSLPLDNYVKVCVSHVTHTCDRHKDTLSEVYQTYFDWRESDFLTLDNYVKVCVSHVTHIVWRISDIRWLTWVTLCVIYTHIPCLTWVILP